MGRIARGLPLPRQRGRGLDGGLWPLEEVGPGRPRCLRDAYRRTGGGYETSCKAASWVGLSQLPAADLLLVSD